MTTLPEPTRVYQNHHIDSTRWDGYSPRQGDIVVATSYKAGTTWMQNIVGHLVFQSPILPGPIPMISPWVDARFMPYGAEELHRMLDAQTHRRFMKSHLPLDGLRLREECTYVIVGRDGRDVFMSLWNHYSNYTPAMMESLNTDRPGDEFPPAGDDPLALYRKWITRGWFEWENDGWPYWSHLHFVQSWWAWRHLPNVLLVHFADLLSDLDGEMRRVSDFLDIPVDDSVWPTLVEASTFGSMRKNAERIMMGAEMVWEGGAKTFINKGTNGRWRDLLTDDDLTLYDRAVKRTLTPDCAEWLEHGRGAVESSSRRG